MKTTFTQTTQDCTDTISISIDIEDGEDEPTVTFIISPIGKEDELYRTECFIPYSEFVTICNGIKHHANTYFPQVK